VARTRRVAEERGIDEKEAERQIRAADRTRADYLKRFYGINDEVPTHYDLVVNTDVLSSGSSKHRCPRGGLASARLGYLLR